MNTSMTINALAAWLLASMSRWLMNKAPIAKASGHDAERHHQGISSRGTYILPAGLPLKLTADTIAWCLQETPKWNLMNVCSPFAGSRRDAGTQELVYALATAIAVPMKEEARRNAR